MSKFVIPIILFILLLASGGDYWGALPWVAEKGAGIIEWQLEQMLDR